MRSIRILKRSRTFSPSIESARFSSLRPLSQCSERLAELARERGIPSKHIDGTSTDRKAILRRFATGETRLLSNGTLLTEGFDEPSIDCIVCLRPTKIRSLLAQIVGRGTHIHPGKDHLLLLDFLWLTQRHNLIHPAHLVPEDDEEADAITKGLRDGAEGDLLEASGRVRQDKLDRLARELERSRQKQAESFDLFEFVVAIGDVHLAKFEPTMRWHQDSMTSKQRDFLARCGVSMGAVKSKGHAAALITRLSKRRQMGLATFKQVRLMRKLGIPNPHLISFRRAGEIIDRLCARKAPLCGRPVRSRAWTMKAIAS
jgi:hypothetical protein